MTHTATTIDIVIPLYVNHYSLYSIIQRCLDSLDKFYPDFNKIIIDDDSPLAHGFPVTFRNKENLGFTKTVNQGLLRTKGDVIIVANDDLFFKKGDLDRYRTIGDGIYFPRDTASGNLDLFGAIWGMSRNTYKKMGLLDESFPHYYSDREYYERAIKMGVPVVKWDDIIVEHYESATYKHTKHKI